MIARKTRTRLEKASKLAFSALVLLTSFSGMAAAQEIRIGRVGVSAPMDAAAAGAQAGAAISISGLGTVGAPSVFASPAIGRGAAAPAALAPSFVSASPAPALSALPAAAAAAPANQALAEPQGAGSVAAFLDRPATSASPRAGPALDPALLSAADGPRSAETDRDGAERGFSAMLGERLAEGKGETAAAPVAAAPASSRRTLGRTSRAGAGYLAALPAVAILGFHPSLQAVLHPSVAAWHMISETGNWIGNVGCAIFPLIQIYETFHGKSTPKYRALLGAAASLALGLFSAPLLHDALWGLQNVFGGITLLVPLLIGGFVGRVRGNGLKETAVIAASAAALSVAAYFASVAAMPGLLAAVFSAAAIAKLTIGVQVATSGMFMWMYLPEAVRILRGRPSDGFSQGFTLVYFISSAASVLWALPSAWILHNPHQLSYRLIFGVNVVYALTSFLCYWVTARRAKAR